MKRLLILTFVTTTAAANAVVFDNFANGNISVPLTGTASDSRATAATVLGGVRTTFASISDNPFDLGAQQVIKNGLYSISGDFGVQTTSGLSYGFDLSGNPNDLNLDLSGESAFEVDFAGTDQPLTYSIRVFSKGTFFTASQTVSSAGASYIPFSAYSGPDFSNVDHLILFFSTPPSGDVGITSFGTVPVPEPASLTAFGLCCAVLLRRRR